MNTLQYWFAGGIYYIKSTHLRVLYCVGCADIMTGWLVEGVEHLVLQDIPADLICTQSGSYAQVGLHEHVQHTREPSCYVGGEEFS